MCRAYDNSDSLCEALRAATIRLASEEIDEKSMEGFVASRLVALDKDPGVRPIGIGEVFRRIIGKAIARATRTEIREAAGALQVCAGLEGGCEAAVHAMCEAFDADDTEAALLIDADNGFNRLNRQAALANCQVRAPSLAPYLKNTYRGPARLFCGDKELSSEEGTTQGDPLGMAMYAIGVVPIIMMLTGEKHPQLGTATEPLPDLEQGSDGEANGPSKQVWFAGDATMVGRLRKLRAQWDLVNKVGPPLGYHPKSSKTWLVVKPHLLGKAEIIFKDTGVQISAEGQRHLGAALGSRAYRARYAGEHVAEWTQQLRTLSEIGRTYPRAAHAGFTKGFGGKVTYFMRTIQA